MSLDVYLMMDGVASHGSGIFVREDGATREITRAEWDEKFPGREPVVARCENDGEVFHRNITHNLVPMASEAGLYDCLWRPEEHGITTAEQLIEPMRVGLERLRTEPARFEAMNPENGWGSYDSLVKFVAAYLEAAEKYPLARVSVWR